MKLKQVLLSVRRVLTPTGKRLSACRRGKGFIMDPKSLSNKELLNVVSSIEEIEEEGGKGSIKAALLEKIEHCSTFKAAELLLVADRPIDCSVAGKGVRS